MYLKTGKNVSMYPIKTISLTFLPLWSTCHVLMKSPSNKIFLHMKYTKPFILGALSFRSV